MVDRHCDDHVRRQEYGRVPAKRAHAHPRDDFQRDETGYGADESGYILHVTTPCSSPKLSRLSHAVREIFFGLLTARFPVSFELN